MSSRRIVLLCTGNVAEHQEMDLFHRPRCEKSEPIFTNDFCSFRILYFPSSTGVFSPKPKVPEFVRATPTTSSRNAKNSHLTPAQLSRRFESPGRPLCV
eukprot:1379510-Amorphochlora_amoeboformis.AAC.1